ncbi:MAG: hypothetical protein QHG99_09200 [Methanomicrobiales archaeon]|nr:hypothetical protein [Methanomicrobiales archaeon]
MEIEILDLEERDYRCVGCGERFKSTLDKPTCPACGSKDVVTEDA